MKKSLLLACLLSVCAVSSFAQSPAYDAGAKRVAERDAAYAKAHPVGMNTTAPVVHHAKKRHGKHHRRVMHKATK